MRKISFKLICVTLVAILAFSGCNDDNDYENVWLAVGTIEKTGEGNDDFRVKLDDSTILNPIENNHPGFETEENQRVVVNFTILTKEQAPNDLIICNVRINTINEVLTKDIIEIDDENADSIGNDPVRVRDGWIVNNYLNFQFDYYGGGETHYINLVKDPDNLQDSEGVYLLEFRHNANDDRYSYVLNGLVSFDLNSLALPEGEEVKIRVRADGFSNNIYEETFSYTHSVE